MAHPELELIRQRFHKACGYCGVTETDVGSELTIDHYRPLAKGGGEDENNLIYACMKCNQFKGDFWPDDEQIEQETRILHPFLDDLSAHLVVNVQTGYLEPITKAGKFHIGLLRLNRPQLVEHRLVRQIQILLIEKHRLLERQIAELQKTIEVQENYIAMLEAQMDENS